MPIERFEDKVILRHPKGSSVEILFYGATVTSWRSGNAQNPEPLERLFVSSKAALDGSKPVRGGIPVVFPCFGAPTHPEHVKLGQHGFARSEIWSWNEVVMDNEAGVSIRLTLEPNEKISNIFRQPFHLGYVVTLAEHQLSTNIHVANTSTDALEFQALLHNYIRAPANQVLVAPLQNLSYYDKTEQTAEGKATPKVETRVGVDVKKYTDSVYEDAPQRYEVTWPGGGLAVKSKNMKDVVVWNPQEEGRKIGDMEEEGWEKYLCVEPGHVRGFVKLEAGKTWVGQQVLSTVLGGGKSIKEVNRYISKLKKSLNHAIALSLKRDPLSSNSQYIRAILLVKGVHFYGFHSSYNPFLKVYMADPGYIHRTVAILQSGTVMDTRFLIFESHLSYALQFMCDFGLYGCGWIDVANVLQRDVQSAMDDDVSLPASNEQIFDPSPYLRQTRMPLEVDVIAPNILNRHNITARNFHHKLQISSTSLTAEPLVLSVRELWEDERQRRIARGLDPSPTIPVDPSDSLRGPGSDWVAEAEYWDQIRAKIEVDREAHGSRLSSSNGWDNWVMTTFESTESLWDEQWRTWKPPSERPQVPCTMTANNEALPDAIVNNPSDWNAPDDTPIDPADNEVIDVDISKLSSQEVVQLIDNELSEWAHPGEEAELGTEENLDDSELLEEDIEDASRPSTLSDPFEAPETSHDQVLPLDKEFRLTSPPERLYTESDVPSPTTPTRGGKSASPLWPSGHADELMSGSEDTIMDIQCTADRFELPKKSLSHPDNSDTDTSFQQRKLDFAPLDQEFPPPDNYFSSPAPPSGANEKEPTNATIKLFKELYSVHTLRTVNLNSYEYAVAPPSTPTLLRTLDEHGLHNRLYQPPHYSSSPDIPERPKEYAGLLFHLKGGNGITHLEAWNAVDDAHEVSQLASQGIGGWEYSSLPPCAKDIRRWLAENQDTSRTRQLKMKSQIEGTTQANIYGLKDTLCLQAPVAPIPRGRQTMGILALEVYAPTSEGKAPNADINSIAALFYTHQSSEEVPPRSGTIVVQGNHPDQIFKAKGQEEAVDCEIDLINKVIDIVGDLDPDIVTGWDVQRGSWGYLNDRARHHGFDFCELVARAPPLHAQAAGFDQWGLRKTSTFKVAGRHVLNLWRLMRSEYNLTSYSFENVVFNVLQRRVPRYSNATLAAWYHGVPSHKTKILQYFSRRTSMLLNILDKSEVITKTAEFARVFGVDFFSVISRGSQFKVESFMFRIAKPESFVLVSPSKQDVGRQNAAECMPLIMEPTSAFYSSPLVVLDFQSLYPSIMIAYNYCYSTCLGRVKDFQGRNKLGVVDLDLPSGLLASLEGHLQVAPNGMIYVKSEVRKGLLGRMLIELLGTRVMVKQAMKGVKDDKVLRRVLDARQLGLKYIANVTYGYTSATFSGRMPAVEIADSIVQSGRETLEKLNTFTRYLRGRTKEQAFRIGHDMADTITAMNPAPVKLKFEKVYLPCVLMAKKRYVGFKYENIDDTEPSFDAKGIETVRRDGIPAQQKMVEVCLKMLFRSQDLSAVKDYCCRTWTKLFENRASVQDFIFAKEVRMGTYSEKGPPPPGVVVAAKRMVEDPTNEPQYGERVPRLQLDAVYYISRVLIPPLERIFNLVGADVRSWFDEMPKPRHLNPTSSPMKTMAGAETPDRLNIEEHFQSSHRIQSNERRIKNAHQICATCCDSALTEPIHCESLDCAWMYARKRAHNKEDFLDIVKEIIEDLSENIDSDGDDDSTIQSNESDESDGIYQDFAYQTP
ncbi:hypothetical protein DXG01_000205 [Tephrocybe rancida]|nr:hypothetical protein DXG01_000205 [Tephrocybe rancida]